MENAFKFIVYWFVICVLESITLFAQQPTDLTYVPLATAAEVAEFNRLKNEQEGVGILAGGTTKPIYFHHNKPKVVKTGWPDEPAEYTYKYPKETLVGDVDCWYPVQEFRITVCGTLSAYKICPANLEHKYLTQDRDFNFHIKPNPPFNSCLSNRWYNDNYKPKIFSEIEGEVNALDLELDPDPNKAFKNTYSTKNPIFDVNTGKIKQTVSKNICIYGPWMLDDLKSLGIDYQNNEIHPINQFWFRDANGDLNLTTIVDGENHWHKEGKGYDGKQANYEWPASGIREYAQFHIAFELKPTEFKDFTVYGSSYDTPMPAAATKYAIPQILTWRGREVIKVSPVYENGTKCYTVSFDKVRKRSDGTVQGYIVVQTEPITQGKGSVSLRYKQESVRDDKYVRTVGDVNGDGKADIVGFGEAGVYVAFSNGTGFGPEQFVLADFAIGKNGWQVDKHVRTMGDVNGDGKDDIIGFGQAGVYVAFSNGTGFAPGKFVLADFAIDKFGWQVDKHVRTVGDVNGDGKADIIGFGQAGVYVAFSNGTGFEPTKFVLAKFAIDAGGWQVGKHVRTVGDVNGDGKADIIGFGQAGVYVAFSNGTGFGPEQFVLADFAIDKNGWQVGKHVRTIGDVNGDGKDDIIGFGQAGVYTGSSNGNGFGQGQFVLAKFAIDAGGW